MGKPLTGEDASVLALLAQAPDLPKDQRNDLIGSLSGEARAIARALVGQSSDKRAKETAAAFRKWANGLGERADDSDADG